MLHSCLRQMYQWHYQPHSMSNRLAQWERRVCQGSVPADRLLSSMKAWLCVTLNQKMPFCVYFPTAIFKIYLDIWYNVKSSILPMEVFFLNGRRKSLVWIYSNDLTLPTAYCCSNKHLHNQNFISCIQQHYDSNHNIFFMSYGNKFCLQ
jgi:hypothetical protein